MVFARLMGSCSTGSATAVANRTREVTAAVARLTHGSSVCMYRSSGSVSSPVPGCAASRLTGIWVFGHGERAEPVLVGKPCRFGRCDAAVAGEEHETVIHALN